MTLPARLLAPAFLLVTLAAPATSGQIGRDADLLRTGWYPAQPQLTHALVASPAFGQRFATPVTGAVYAQPLLYGNTLFVATQADWIYGLDPHTGAVQWSRNVGTPINASDFAGCFDITPVIGITSTPVIDDASGIAYFTSKTYVTGTSGAARWSLHAVAVATGVEQAGFPVTLSGKADNDNTQTFPPTTQNQRPGLLLMNGVVYAGFGSVCDITPWQGWVFGVSTSGAITCRWVVRTGRGNSGGGIWMAGSAPVSDVSGQFVLATGNGAGGGTPTGTIPGTSPPAQVSESIVRLAVQANGTVKPVDFFTPWNSFTDYDPTDLDLGSGGVVGLPPAYFGTAAHPRLMVQIGKPGEVYLLDAGSLGGCGMASDGTDSLVQEFGFEGGVWSKPAVWPGDGGWVYVASADTSLSADGSYGWLHAYQYGVDGGSRPMLSRAAISDDIFGFGSSAPIVTSDGATSGSGILWIVWFPDDTGYGAMLRAYDVLPAGGAFQLLGQWPVGRGCKFNPPGVGSNWLYVGSRDETIYGFAEDPAAAGVAPAAPPSLADLGPATPNPFRGATRLALSLARDTDARIAVYDLAGRRVRDLASGPMSAGRRDLAWDGRDEAGVALAPGLYLVRLDAGELHRSRRVLLVR